MTSLALEACAREQRGQVSVMLNTKQEFHSDRGRYCHLPPLGERKWHVTSPGTPPADLSPVPVLSRDRRERGEHETPAMCSDVIHGARGSHSDVLICTDETETWEG